MQQFLPTKRLFTLSCTCIFGLCVCLVYHIQIACSVYNALSLSVCLYIGVSLWICLCLSTILSFTPPKKKSEFLHVIQSVQNKRISENKYLDWSKMCLSIKFLCMFMYIFMSFFFFFGTLNDNVCPSVYEW